MQHTLTASNEARGSAGFYPPQVRPAARPLRFPSNLIKLLNNNLEIIPEQAYREPVVFSPGPLRMAFFTDAELVKLLLLTRQPEFPKGRVQNETLRPLFGEAMISAEGREWRWQRAAAAPLFRHEELLQYGPIMTASAEATVETWRTDSPGAIRLINKDMMRAAYRVISSTMLAGGAEDVLHQIEKGHTDYFHNVNWWPYMCFWACLTGCPVRVGRRCARTSGGCARPSPSWSHPGAGRRRKVRTCWRGCCGHRTPNRGRACRTSSSSTIFFRFWWRATTPPRLQ